MEIRNFSGFGGPKAENPPFGLGKTKVSWRVADWCKALIFSFSEEFPGILAFSIKVTIIPEITWISQICMKITLLRRGVKTTVIISYFNHSGAHFLPGTSQNHFFRVSCAILLKINQIPSIFIKTVFLLEFMDFPLLRRPRSENINNS